MLWARTGLARQQISSAWRTHVRRVYRALVQGSLEDGETTIETPIGLVPHPLLGTVFAATPRGKPSLSRVRLLERRRDTSLVEVELLTGRPHQIRIHLAAAGHPLTGDPLYTIGGAPRPESRSLPGDLGYLLHAERVRFPHPETGRPVEVTCLPPPSLRDSLTV
jgi:23S rRNA pseudouridine1911/1915/1917 synthase